MQESGELTIYTLNNHNMTIVKIPEISSYEFLQKPVKSLEDIAKNRAYSLAVNGSYFDYDSPAPGFPTNFSFLHAGYLKIQDSVYAEMMEGDKQLTTLFTYNYDEDRAGYFGLNELDQAQGYDLIVQTGPQIIRDSQISMEDIRASINGMGQHARTAFATVNETEHYVIVVRKTMLGAGMTLEELGQVLLETGIFTGSLNVVNFDGGSSTFLYIKDHPELSFHSGRQILPILLGVK